MKQLSTTFIKSGTVLAVTVLFLVSQSAARTPKKISSAEAPGTLAVNDTLRIDRTEVTNFHWLEYLHWLSNTYGPNSIEYRAALPDTVLWKYENEYLAKYANAYLRAPYYRNYPVVGLTYSQMTAYCNWRSDRVLEYILIHKGIISSQKKTTPENHFTTERFVTGNYQHVQPGSYLDAVPEYYLPTEKEWLVALHYAERIYAQQQTKKGFVKCDQFFNTYSFNGPHTVVPDRRHSVKAAIYCMRRNVSEQLSDSTLCAGESWKPSYYENDSDLITRHPEASVSKGFRCAFRWKKIS